MIVHTELHNVWHFAEPGRKRKPSERATRTGYITNAVMRHAQIWSGTTSGTVQLNSSTTWMPKSLPNRCTIRLARLLASISHSTGYSRATRHKWFAFAGKCWVGIGTDVQFCSRSRVGHEGKQKSTCTDSWRENHRNPTKPMKNHRKYNCCPSTGRSWNNAITWASLVSTTRLNWHNSLRKAIIFTSAWRIW